MKYFRLFFFIMLLVFNYSYVYSDNYKIVNTIIVEKGEYYIFDEEYKYIISNLKSKYNIVLNDKYDKISLDWNTSDEYYEKYIINKLENIDNNIELMIVRGTNAAECIVNIIKEKKVKNQWIYKVPICIYSVSNPVSDKIVDSIEDSGIDNVFCRILDVDRYYNMINVYHNILKFKKLGYIRNVDKLYNLDYSRFNFPVKECIIKDENNFLEYLNQIDILKKDGVDALFMSPIKCNDVKENGNYFYSIIRYCILNNIYPLSREGTYQVEYGALLGYNDSNYETRSLFLSNVINDMIFNKILPRKIKMLNKVKPSLSINLNTASKFNISSINSLLSNFDERINEVKINGAINKFNFGVIRRGPLDIFNEELIEIQKSFIRKGYILDIDNMYFISMNNYDISNEKDNFEFYNKVNKIFEYINLHNGAKPLDMILVQGTDATIVVYDLLKLNHRLKKNYINKIPFYCTSITDPVKSKIISSYDDSEIDNVSMRVGDPKRYYNMFVTTYNIIRYKKLGIMCYNNSVFCNIDDVIEFSKKYNVNIIIKSISHENDCDECFKAVKELVEVDKIDIFYHTPLYCMDIGYNNKCFDNIINYLIDNKVVTMSRDGDRFLRNGIVIGYSESNYVSRVTFITDNMFKILVNNMVPRSVKPIINVSKPSLYLNYKVSEKIGILDKLDLNIFDDVIK